MLPTAYPQVLQVAISLWKGLQMFLNSSTKSEKSRAKRFTFVQKVLNVGINEPL